MNLRAHLMTLAAATLGLTGAADAATAPKPAPRSVFDFSAVTIDGTTQPLSVYRGRALLIVNTASRCGFTPQYEGLEALYRQYRERGFEVLAFPANDFMRQEPGTDAEIKTFCSTKYNTTFPLFSKISVKGKSIHPLYAFLTKHAGFNGNITWNFNKFLVNPDGKVVARYGSNVEPQSKDLVAKLESILPKKS